MARGKVQKRRKDKIHLKQNKSKFKRKRPQVFRDIKHTEQYAQYKLKLENEKKKKVAIDEEESENEEVVNDPLTLLLSTFKSNRDKILENIAIDSEESSDEDESDKELEREFNKQVYTNHLEDASLTDGNGISSSSKVRKEESDYEENDNNENDGNNDNDDNNDDDSDHDDDDDDDDDKNLKADEEIEIDILGSNIAEAENNNKNDPFHVHFNYDLDDTLLESVSSIPMKVKSLKLYWPVLHNLKIEIPLGSKEKNETEKGNFGSITIREEVEYAKEYTSPALIQSVDFDRLFIKSQFQKNIYKANKKHADVSSEDFTELQKELFSIINNYQDLFYCERSLENGEHIRFIYCLHAVNHILKTRFKILHHNSKISKNSKDLPPDEFRDQGLVRPKVLIIVPFRDSCLRIVNMMCSILLYETKGNIINKKRFYEEFKGSELIMPKKNPKPEDYEHLFQGNIDDNFRIGLSFTKKSIKLYSDFYSSDIIIASPLGLRMVIGAEGDKERDYDFLASIEILILDQTEVFLMQNWDHLLLIFEHLHIQPKESHGTDFSRVRSWALNGWTKFYRQTLLFASVISSELNAIFNRRCFNYAGKIRVMNPVEDGSICRVIVSLCHVFQKFKTDSVSNALDDRFRLFTEKIMPQYKDPIMTGVLVYIPSYFDYVRIRNYLKQSDYNFVQICEYSKDAKVARARDMFFHNEVRILIYSERFHFFRRINLKGIRHVIFYQPPTIPHFYSEICNLMQEGNQNKFLANDTMMTVSVLYCKYDIHQLSGIVKTSRAAKIIASEKSVHMFSTG